jgi:hypothetical protein
MGKNVFRQRAGSPLRDSAGKKRGFARRVAEDAEKWKTNAAGEILVNKISNCLDRNHS